jgi:hypothetical protein
LASNTTWLCLSVFLQDEENGLHSLMFKKREKSGEPIMSFCLSG